MECNKPFLNLVPGTPVVAQDAVGERLGRPSKVVLLGLSRPNWVSVVSCRE